ncbi:MAG TPA: hypothetical protein DDW50_13340 [Firmicutes bacterium]|nr:hypothetical protein [Bacillota bacterium]
MRVTIKKIAEIAGVSVGTASEALNNTGRINTKTAERVLQVADSLNYRPNSMAKALISQKSSTIGFVLDFYQNIRTHMGSAEMLIGAINEASLNNYDMLTTIASKDVNIIDHGLNLFNSKKIDGVLFYGVRPNNVAINKLIEKGVPYVILSGGIWDDRIVTVTLDTVKAAYTLVEYLVKKGHKKIAHISGSDQTYGGIGRKSGYLGALKQYDISEDEGLIVTTSYGVEYGYNAIKELLLKRPDVTAVFCGSDDLAVGACNYLKEINMNIGTDIDIVCISNDKQFVAYTPKLTTIGIDFRKMGRLSTHLLFEWLKNDGIPDKKIVMDYKFLKGDTA